MNLKALLHTFCSFDVSKDFCLASSQTKVCHLRVIEGCAPVSLYHIMYSNITYLREAGYGRSEHGPFPMRGKCAKCRIFSVGSLWIGASFMAQSIFGRSDSFRKRCKWVNLNKAQVAWCVLMRKKWDGWPKAKEVIKHICRGVTMVATSI